MAIVVSKVIRVRIAGDIEGRRPLTLLVQLMILHAVNY